VTGDILLQAYPTFGNLICKPANPYFDKYRLICLACDCPCGPIYLRSATLFGRCGFIHDLLCPRLSYSTLSKYIFVCRFNHVSHYDKTACLRVVRLMF
ncbi:unnamed protein product, partial [Amoebophrya sp. A25]